MSGSSRAACTTLRHALPFRATLAALTLHATPLEAQARQRIEVAANVHVSAAHPAAPHFETQIAAHPRDSAHIIGCAMRFSTRENRFTTVVHLSRDGGRTWRQTLELDRGLTSFDPTCVIAPDGTAYFAAFGYFESPGGRYEQLVYVSRDGGATWSEPTTARPILDRLYVTPGPRPSELIVHGTTEQLAVLRGTPSPEGTIRFDPVVRAPRDDATFVYGMGNGIVLDDSTVLVVHGAFRHPAPGTPLASGRLVALRITTRQGIVDSARVHLDSAVTIGDVHLGAGPQHSSIPSLAIDRSAGPFAGRLHVVWGDVRSGRSQVLLSRSADGGRTWSAPVVVSDNPEVVAREQRTARSPADALDGSAPDAFMPNVAVNPAGVVGVSWHDRRPDGVLGDTAQGWYVRFAASHDGGESFMPSVRVSEAPFRTDLASPTQLFPRSSGGGAREDWARGGPIRIDFNVDRFYSNAGDTGGLTAASDGTFHPLWIDTRTGVPQLWTTRIRVEGAAVRYGDPALSAMRDVTQAVTVDFANATFDRAKGRLIADVVITNTSAAAITGPFTIQVLALTSPLGRVMIVGSSNGRRGTGATIRVGASGSDSATVAPGGRSVPTRIELDLPEARSKALPPLTGFGLPVVSLDARVLAPAAGARQ